jgi:ABC-2 type transport system ATP-binding protein
MISSQNLTKKYGDLYAASGIDLHVQKGEIYGFLGLNGAGKTSVIRMLLGLIKPTSGSASIDGIKVSPQAKHLWEKVGYLVETPCSYSNLTVRENLEMVRRLRLINHRNAVDRIMDELELKPYEKVKAGHLSLGNAQRLGLARAMIHQPQILILDEPTNGFDPAGIYKVRHMLKQLADERGVTIFISSHILGEISRFCTRIGIIHQGKLLKELNTSELKDLCQLYLVLKTASLEKASSVLNMHGFKELKQEENTLRIYDQKALEAPELIADLLVRADCPPSHLALEQEDLEAFFLRTTHSKTKHNANIESSAVC